MATIAANSAHYDNLAKQHAKNPDAFMGKAVDSRGAPVKGEKAVNTDKADAEKSSGKGVPAKIVASKLIPGLMQTKGGPKGRVGGGTEKAPPKAIKGG